jgi:hypothetical protein
MRARWPVDFLTDTQGETPMNTSTHYVYTASNTTDYAVFTSMREAKAQAAKWAREGRMTDVVRHVAGPDGKPQTNIGRVHTSFPNRA